MSKKILLFLVFVILILVGIGWRSQSGKNANAILQIEVVPKKASISLNGKKAKPGELNVEPGSYAVVVSATGFAEDKTTVDIKAGEKKYVGIALDPNDSSTEDYYQKHPEESVEASGIATAVFDHTTDAIRQKFPLVTKLPQTFRQFVISYGPSLKYPDDPTHIAILIHSVPVQDRQAALDWIKKQGFDPVDYEIIFTDFVNPFIQGG